MEISDIRVKLIQDSSDRLKAVCSITLDDEFVVRDLKVVEGTNGLFVAMPSRKLSVNCPQCRSKNHLRARFCNECGAKLPPARPTGDAAGRMRMHRDIAHPINPTFREIVQSKVIEKYRAESELAKDPNYTPPDIDAEFETTSEKASERTSETMSEETGGAYAPSEYDQLIAGLNKGSQEAARESLPPPRPAPRAPRTNDRRSNGHGERPPRAPRGRDVRPARHDSRRQESPRPQPNRGQDRRPMRPAQPTNARSNDSIDDEVNGNIAQPGDRTPAYPRRNKPPAWKRIEEPKSMAEPRLDQFDEPTPRRTAEAPRYTEEPPVERVQSRAPVPPVPIQPAPIRPVPAQPAPRPPAPAPPLGHSARSEDLPFGAGL